LRAAGLEPDSTTEIALSSDGAMPYLAPACSKQVAWHENASGNIRAMRSVRVMATMVGSQTVAAGAKCDF